MTTEAAPSLLFDSRPCEVTCCDRQRDRHVHEGTHEGHVGDGTWCIDCDVVIGQGSSASLLQERDRLDVLLAAERLSISRAAHSTVKAINDAPGPLHDPRAHERTLEKMVARHEAEYARLSTQPSTLKPIEDEFDFTIERIGPAQGGER